MANLAELTKKLTKTTQQLYICPRWQHCKATLCSHRVPHVLDSDDRGYHCRAVPGHCPECELAEVKR